VTVGITTFKEVLKLIDFVIFSIFLLFPSKLFEVQKSLRITCLVVAGHPRPFTALHVVTLGCSHFRSACQVPSFVKETVTMIMIAKGSSKLQEN
jgi:hypothetical protein